MGYLDELDLEKSDLKRIREFIDEMDNLDRYRKKELKGYVNMIIGQINCEYTDDDIELNTMAKKDGIHE